MAPKRLDRSQWVAKTQAKSLYCLTDRELEPLESEERPNPRARRGPPMRLYQKEDLERAALSKWGSLAALEAERERRQEKREQRTIASYFAQQGAAQGQAAAGAGAPGEGGQSGQHDLQEEQEGQAMQVDTASPAAPRSSQQAQQAQQARPASALPMPVQLRPDWVRGLPPLLAERVCMVPRQAQQAQQAQGRSLEQGSQAGQQGGPQGGRYVLYWMKTAVRGHENPALDAAAAAAASLGVPLVAASFLLTSHPYASARRWKFLLEGLRDAQGELRRQGVELLIYVEGHSDAAEADAAGEPAAGQPHSTAAAAAGAKPAPSAGAGAAADPYTPAFSFSACPGFQETAGWQELLRLASGASLVVTEDMPVPPDTDWLLALGEQLPAEVPLAAVDTACVLPMRLVRKCHEKAYAFRSATEAQRKQRIARTYPLAPGTAPVGHDALAPPPADLARLPAAPAALLSREGLGWQPLDLAGVPPTHLPQRLAALLARCAGLDHSVPGVAHMIGGSVAGYARWEAFRKRGLSLYAARRNDPMLREGTSRLSAYLHWGMVSPFKVAREAAMDRSAGASKFLDEFLIWREIGFNLCLHRHALLHSLGALPQWARDTLESHAPDPRPGLLQYARVAAGDTGDAWWDAAQRQLVKTGELHNWSRMTWGKAFLGWAPTPQAALGAALHTNHRFALDGCDPASYAGVLWCFGMYDGPKSAADTPVSGSLATKSTAAAARRLPPVAYAALAV